MAIMSTFSLLATAAAEVAAHEGAEGGFGFNFDILETNLINLSIIIGVLFFFGRKILGKTLSERRTNIEEAIQEAEKGQKEAAAALADAQQKLAKAQAEAERIRAAAQENAQAARAAIMEERSPNCVNELLLWLWKEPNHNLALTWMNQLNNN
jgi:F-type H+-transporting ATPase subunit b